MFFNFLLIFFQGLVTFCCTDCAFRSLKGGGGVKQEGEKWVVDGAEGLPYCTKGTWIPSRYMKERYRCQLWNITDLNITYSTKTEFIINSDISTDSVVRIDIILCFRLMSTYFLIDGGDNNVRMLMNQLISGWRWFPVSQSRASSQPGDGFYRQGASPTSSLVDTAPQSPGGLHSPATRIFVHSGN